MDTGGTRLSLVRSERSQGDRSTSLVKIRANAERAFSDAFQISGTEPRHDVAPFADGGGAEIQRSRDVGLDRGNAHLGDVDPKRPRDIRGSLKVIKNVLLEHAPMLTALKSKVQPQLSRLGLTSVDMDKFATLKDRLVDAMGEEISASDLARACGVSAAAVSKWLDGTTKKLSAENYAAAARALGVREEWLRTGRLPRDREHADEERQIDQVIDVLEGLRAPLASLAAAIDQLTKIRTEPQKKRGRA